MTSHPIPIPRTRMLASLMLAAAVTASAPHWPASRPAPPPVTVAPVELVPPRQMIPAEVVRIIDGDTVEMRALIWLDQHVVTRVRLRGIDAPERDPRCPEENRRAEAATAALRDLLGERTLHLTDIGRDKYGGRVIARIIVGARGDAGTVLVAMGHARPYGGGRRERRCV